MAKDKKIKIKVQLPDKDTPGFLRRQRDILKYAPIVEAMVPVNGVEPEEPDIEDIEALVGFFAQFVIEPKNKQDAENALWEASREQFFEILDAVTNIELPKAKGEVSENGTSPE